MGQDSLPRVSYFIDKHYITQNAFLHGTRLSINLLMGTSARHVFIATIVPSYTADRFGPIVEAQDRHVPSPLPAHTRKRQGTPGVYVSKGKRLDGGFAGLA